jgi:hypothetical protein
MYLYSRRVRLGLCIESFRVARSYIGSYLDVTAYVTSKGRMTVNGEIRRTREEATVACFKMLYHHLLGESAQNHKITSISVSGMGI